MLPYLLAERGPLWNPTLEGAFLGVRSHHRREHFVRAAVEGVALQMWTICSELDRLAPLSEIRCTGGVFRSSLWRQVLADVFPWPLRVAASEEGSALGAAALGMFALGHADSLSSGLNALAPSLAHHTSVVSTPDNSSRDTYERMKTSLPALIRSYTTVATLFEGLADDAAQGTRRKPRKPLMS